MVTEPPLHEGLHPVMVRSPPLTLKVKPPLGDVGVAKAVEVQIVATKKGTISAIADNRILEPRHDCQRERRTLTRVFVVAPRKPRFIELDAQV